MPARTGVGWAIVKVTPFEDGAFTPPLRTKTVAVPAWAISAAGTVALRCVDESLMVARSALLQTTVPPLAVCLVHTTTAPYGPVAKLAPLTSSVNAGPPGAAHAGLIDVIDGGAYTGSSTSLLYLLPPGRKPGLTTWTRNVPGTVSKAAGIVAIRESGEK